jgi:TRAP-type C4-dicarboxylate transport system permease small subunit
VLIRLRRTADRLVEAMAVIVALAMLAVVVLGVMFRAFNNPLVWSDELAQYLLVWLGFLGWMIATRRRSHIRIMVVIDKLPDLLRRAAEIVLQLAIIAFACVLMWQARSLIGRNIDIEAVTLPFPSALLYCLLPPLALLLILQAVGEIGEAVAGGDRKSLDQGGQAL